MKRSRYHSKEVDSTRRVILSELDRRGVTLWKFADHMNMKDLCCRNTMTDWLTGKRKNTSVRIADLARRELGLIVVRKDDR